MGRPYSMDLRKRVLAAVKSGEMSCNPAAKQFRLGARTIEAICTAIGEILGTFTSEECANYFRNSGYPT
jgi:hypothetical protein